MQRGRLDRAAEDAGRLLARGDAVGAGKVLSPVVQAARSARPPHAGVLWAWGVSQSRLGHHAEAERAIRGVVTPGGRVDVEIELALVIKRQGRYDESEKILRGVLARQPGQMRAVTMLVEVLSDTKREDEARALLERVKATSPGERGRVLVARARLGVPEGADPRALLDDCRAGVDDASIAPQARGLLATYAGRVCDQAGRHHEAFGWWREAKPLRGLAWDPAAHDARVDALIDAWRSPGAVPESGVDGSGLVFIVGMPRSGTSLLEQMLGRHPRVTPLGERGDVTKAAAAVCRPSGVEFPMVTNTSGLGSELMRRLGVATLGSLRGQSGGGAGDRWTDKLPFNFFHVPFIARLLPGARIIHIRRHPLDTLVSYFSLWFNTPHPQTNDLESIGRYYLGYRRVMDAWRGLGGGVDVLDVAYEDLARDPEAQLRRVLGFADLDWDASVLSPEQSDRVVATASRTQVQASINTRSIGRWTRYEALLGPLIETLGGRDAVEAMGDAGA